MKICSIDSKINIYLSWCFHYYLFVDHRPQPPLSLIGSDALHGKMLVLPNFSGSKMNEYNTLDAFLGRVKLNKGKFFLAALEKGLY